MKVAILCGGKGTRLTERTEHIPKPLVEIGDRPIVWHIMKIYAHYGFSDFILCLGYKGEKIRAYFTAGPNWRPISILSGSRAGAVDQIEYFETANVRWRITFLDTGPDTNTGGRVLQLAPLIDEDSFCVTYGDGVANVDLSALLDFHHQHKRLATLTAVQPFSQFGVLQLAADGSIQRFQEKPRMDKWVNGGYFVFDRGVFDYIDCNDILERGPFEKLASAGQIMAYCHRGFWGRD